MRWFETRGPVYPEDNYVVARTDELADFMNRLKGAGTSSFSRHAKQARPHFSETRSTRLKTKRASISQYNLILRGT